MGNRMVTFIWINQEEHRTSKTEQPVYHCSKLLIVIHDRTYFLPRMHLFCTISAASERIMRFLLQLITSLLFCSAIVVRARHKCAVNTRSKASVI